jgi:hypothetical protein
MIRHVVMWKMKEEALGMQRLELAAEFKRRLMSLVGVVPEIGFFQMGGNVLASETAMDVALVSDFADLAALKRYTEHPEHLKVLDFVRQIVAERRAVDFELG